MKVETREMVGITDVLCSDIEELKIGKIIFNIESRIDTTDEFGDDEVLLVIQPVEIYSFYPGIPKHVVDDVKDSIRKVFPKLREFQAQADRDKRYAKYLMLKDEFEEKDTNIRV